MLSSLTQLMNKKLEDFEKLCSISTISITKARDSYNNLSPRYRTHFDSQFINFIYTNLVSISWRRLSKLARDIAQGLDGISEDERQKLEKTFLYFLQRVN